MAGTCRDSTRSGSRCSTGGAVILFDALNTSFSEQSAARETQRKFVQRQPPGRVAALYGLSHHLSLLADFTSEREALLRGIDSYAPAENLNRGAAAPRMSATGFVIDTFINLANGMEAEYYMPERRVRPTLAALAAIAGRIAGIPGRKNLIWISGSFPVSFSARRWNAVNIAVYPISTAGIVSLDISAEDHLGLEIGPSSWGANLSHMLPDFSDAAIGQMAERTGGMMSASNDLGDQLQRAFDDGREDYLIGFSAPSWDGKYHALQVKVHSSGAKACARQGYDAVDEPAADPANRLREAEVNAGDAMEIPIDVAAAKRGDAAALTVTTKVQAPGSALGFAPDGRGWIARAKLVFVERDASGKRIMQSNQDLAMKLSDARHAQAAATGLRFTTPIAMRGGAEQLRVVLQDQASGAVGSVTMALREIPAQ